MKNRSCTGFTLVELVVALAVAGILLGVGIPSFTSAVKNSKQSSHYQRLAGALFLARSEAVKQASPVTVCARQSDTACAATVAATDWDNGFLVFSDPDGVGLNRGQVDAADTMLQIIEPIEGDTEVYAKAYTSSSPNFVVQPYVRYQSDGGTNWQGGSFWFCDDRGNDESVAMNIVLTGDIRKARGAPPKDTNGDEVDCPE